MNSSRNKDTRGQALRPAYVLDRIEAVPALVGDHREWLIVTGLAGTAKDIAALTDDAHYTFTMAGVMGAAVCVGLGLALAQPDKRVLVVTGDGELLMNVGSLATVAVVNPPNLAILCVDNGHYGETGYQRSHTSSGVDLEAIAGGAGIVNTRTVQSAEQLDDGARALREANGVSFVLLRVKPTDPPKYARNLDANTCRSRFRSNLGVGWRD
ncbi:MAG: thiamine pyrophosphate-binding protein [Gammaproteobacteria bacterium]|nr:thiamine pyrophosphate-binding protein [Gammaproteobacteria bacterium]